MTCIKLNWQKVRPFNCTCLQIIYTSCIHKHDLALNNLQRYIYQKIQPTNLHAWYYGVSEGVYPFLDHTLGSHFYKNRDSFKVPHFLKSYQVFIFFSFIWLIYLLALTYQLEGMFFFYIVLNFYIWSITFNFSISWHQHATCKGLESYR